MKLLIAEDEILALNTLTSIDWSAHDITLVGSAQNGLTALELVKKEKPDIVISDIKMPEMSGIELAGKIASLLPDTKIIIISAYTDFSYAQKAISYGVFDYILKPYRIEQLFEIVEKAKSEILVTRQKNLLIENMNNQLEFSKFFMKDYYLNNISAELLSDDFTSIFGKYNSNQRHIATVIALDKSTDNGHYKKSFNLFSNIQKILQKKYPQCVSFFETYTFTYVLSCEGISESTFANETLDIAESVREYLDFSSYIDFVIGIGSSVDDRTHINSSIISAFNATEYSFYLGKRIVIYISDLEQNNLFYNYRAFYNDSFFNNIKIGDSDTVTATIDSLFNTFAANKEDISVVQRTCHNIYVNLAMCLMQCGQSPSILFNQTDIWALIRQYNDINRLKQFMTDTISVVISNINFTRTNKMTGLVTEIKEYIRANKSATLANIADHFHLSPGYLSVIFSKNTDTTLKNYLINERINTAKDMLINTDKNIYEIANEIGYKTAQHFSVIFKKSTGLTPSAYQDKHKHI